MRKSIQELAREYEGAVNIEADVTPITRQKIEQVDSSKWNELTVSELHDQRAILSQRLALAQTHFPGITKMMQTGLHHLDQMIRERSTDESTLI